MENMSEDREKKYGERAVKSYMYRVVGPCRCRKDNLVGKYALSERKDPAAGKGGPWECLSGYL